MTDLPQLDPSILYRKALTQVSELNAQAIQMDTMIEVLREQLETTKEELVTANQERDEARYELRNLLGATENAVVQGEVVPKAPNSKT